MILVDAIRSHPDHHVYISHRGGVKVRVRNYSQTNKRPKQILSINQESMTAGKGCQK